MRYLAIGGGAFLAVLFIMFFVLAGMTPPVGAGNHCDNVRVPEEAKKSCTTPTPTHIPTPTPRETPTPTPTSTPTPTPTSTLSPTSTPDATLIPTLTPVAISAAQVPAAFPDTGGEPAGLPNAGVGAFAADDGSNYADTLKTVGILLVFIGLATLAFWALFRRG